MSCLQHGARYLRGPRLVGAKRNAGARLAQFDLLFFIDSDCIADAELLRLHLQAHAGPVARSGKRVGAIAGPTVVTDAETAPAWRVVRSSVVVNSPWLWPARFAEVWWAATANLSVSREAFEAAGGFDERTFTVVGGEDVDFGVRLSALGYATVCRPDAVVSHATDGIVRVGQFRQKMFRYGRACVYNCTRQPEHAQWSANPVSLAAAGLVAGVLGLLAGPAEVRRAALVLTLAAPAAAGTGFAVRAVSAARAHSMSARDAVGLVSVDWAFHAGITAEAVRRRRPWRAFQRYDYFPSSRFYPAAAQSEDER
jgi:glycosyl transferase family 2